jgi:hypothetical protein
MDIEVNNRCIMCELFNIKLHKMPHMFQPAVAIIRGSPTLWENTLHILHVCYAFVLHRDLFTIGIKN